MCIRQLSLFNKAIARDHCLNKITPSYDARNYYRGNMNAGQYKKGIRSD